MSGDNISEVQRTYKAGDLLPTGLSYTDKISTTAARSANEISKDILESVINNLREQLRKDQPNLSFKDLSFKRTNTEGEAVIPRMRDLPAGGVNLPEHINKAKSPGDKQPSYIKERPDPMASRALSTDDISSKKSLVLEQSVGPRDHSMFRALSEKSIDKASTFVDSKTPSSLPGEGIKPSSDVNKNIGGKDISYSDIIAKRINVLSNADVGLTLVRDFSNELPEEKLVRDLCCKIINGKDTGVNEITIPFNELNSFEKLCKERNETITCNDPQLLVVLPGGERQPRLAIINEDFSKDKKIISGTPIPYSPDELVVGYIDNVPVDITAQLYNIRNKIPNLKDEQYACLYGKRYSLLSDLSAETFFTDCARVTVTERDGGTAVSRYGFHDENKVPGDINPGKPGSEQPGKKVAMLNVPAEKEAPADMSVYPKKVEPAQILFSNDKRTMTPAVLMGALSALGAVALVVAGQIMHRFGVSGANAADDELAEAEDNEATASADVAIARQEVEDAINGDYKVVGDEAASLAVQAQVDIDRKAYNDAQGAGGEEGQKIMDEIASRYGERPDGSPDFSADSLTETGNLFMEPIRNEAANAAIEDARNTAIDNAQKRLNSAEKSQSSAQITIENAKAHKVAAESLKSSGNTLSWAGPLVAGVLGAVATGAYANHIRVKDKAGEFNKLLLEKDPTTPHFELYDVEKSGAFGMRKFSQGVKP